jgi:hypothetical protein
LDKHCQGVEIKRLALRRELAEKTKASGKKLSSNAQNASPQGGARIREISQPVMARIIHGPDKLDGEQEPGIRREPIIGAF